MKKEWKGGDDISVQTRAGAEGKGEGKASGSSRRRRKDIEDEIKARVGKNRVVGATLRS